MRYEVQRVLGEDIRVIEHVTRVVCLLSYKYLHIHIYVLYFHISILLSFLLLIFYFSTFIASLSLIILVKQHIDTLITDHFYLLR